MHFPKHSNFQVSLFPIIFFSANLYFWKPNYFCSSSLIGEKRIKIIYFLFSITGNTLLLYSSERWGTKINFSQNILSSLLGNAFLHSTVPMMFNIGMFQWINILKKKLSNKSNNKTKTGYRTAKVHAFVFWSNFWSNTRKFQYVAISLINKTNLHKRKLMECKQFSQI